MGHTVRMGTHGFRYPGAVYAPPGASYADLVNLCLRGQTGPVIKVDDHDSYPEDHASIAEEWEPGWLFWGRATFVGCDGQVLGRWPSLCASVFPVLEVRPNRFGQITDSVVAQCRIREVETGVRKLVCPGDWSWSRRPRLRGVECSHD